MGNENRKAGRDMHGHVYVRAFWGELGKLHNEGVRQWLVGFSLCSLILKPVPLDCEPWWEMGGAYVTNNFYENDFDIYFPLLQKLCKKTISLYRFFAFGYSSMERTIAANKQRLHARGENI